MAVVIGDFSVVFSALVGGGLLGLGIFIFVFIQVKGGLGNSLKRIFTFVGIHESSKAFVRISAVNFSLREIYSRRHTLFAGIILRLFQRLFLVGEIVLAGWLIGAPIDILDAIILKGIVGALRGASFVVPGGVGIQEGGYVAIGALLGYPPDAMLVISLATRIREILPHIPFLIIWQITEMRIVIRNAMSNGSQ